MRNPASKNKKWRAIENRYLRVIFAYIHTHMHTTHTPQIHTCTHNTHTCTTYTCTQHTLTDKSLENNRKSKTCCKKTEGYALRPSREDLQGRQLGQAFRKVWLYLAGTGRATPNWMVGIPESGSQSRKSLSIPREMAVGWYRQIQGRGTR